MGAPNDPKFQRKVLEAALNLFNADKGPVLEDFPDDAPVSSGEIVALSCPVDFSQKDENLSEIDKLCDAFKKEVGSLRPWYDLALKERGRTTVGVSRIDFKDIPDFICSFLNGGIPKNPREDLSIHYTLNLAVDDLKAYYTEAITTQPGQESPASRVLNYWFWNDTIAGSVLFKLRDICKNSDDGFMKLVGNVLLVPAEQVNKRKI
jgi:D-proline reductase (dithiol) PrdB